MSVAMQRISVTLATARSMPPAGLDLNAPFDALVVGSGYGGSIAAAKLALAGRRVLLLERGREILPGEYPRTLQQAQAETQITTAEAGRLTDVNGMLDLRINADMSVVIGCGLGGTSLINANVALIPDPRVFTQTGPDGRALWPAAYHDPEALRAAYAEAKAALGAAPLPAEIQLNKLKSLEASAKALGQPFSRLPINVTFRNGENAFGNYQSACTLCGDCCSGCNYGAKNTTLMNYLPLAHANGAQILTEAQVHTVTRDGDGWALRVADFGAPAESGIMLRAPLVVLAAGTLGSTEILMRSVAAGLLTASPALGRRFSGNGDILGFGFDANWTQGDEAAPIYSVGAGSHAPDSPATRPGPCIAGMIAVDMTPEDALKDGIVIQEGVAPGPLSMVYPAAYFFSEVLTADPMRFPDAARRLADIASLGATLTGTGDLDALAYTGAVANTQSYLLMSHDDSGGELVYDPATDGVSVRWKGVGQRFPFPRDNVVLKAASDAIWANYLANPLWSEAFRWQLVTTHPVGGCVLADSARHGVVNKDCAVFTGADDTAVHDGLMVCDGAVIPTSLGLNPLLTISAVTIRAMDRLIAAHGWAVNTAPRPAASSRPADSAPPAPPQSVFRLAAAELEAALAQIEDMIARLEAGETAAVLTALYDRAQTLLGGDLDWTEWGLLNAAYEAALHVHPQRNTEILGILRDDLTALLAIIAPTPPQTDREIVAEMLAWFEARAGDVAPGLSFSETMAGYVSPPLPGRLHPISDAHSIAATEGRADGRRLDGAFTVSSSDIAAMLAEKSHAAALSGRLTLTEAPGAAPRVWRIAAGRFELLKQDEAQVDSWLMTYAGDLGEGRSFRGTKTLRRRPGSDWWTDLTTLDIDLMEGDRVTLRGRLTLGVQDLVRQAQTVAGDYHTTETGTGLAWDVVRQIVLGTLQDRLRERDFLHRFLRWGLAYYAAQAEGAGHEAVAGLTALFEAEAGQLFANLIFRSYGGLVAYLDNFPAQNAPAQPMPARGQPLRTHPEVTPREIGARLDRHGLVRLTRFQGGRKGPVILANGFGFRGMAFALETNLSDGPDPKPQNFVGRLLDEGYDVWVFDHRASPANVPAEGPVNCDYTVDDIARRDWPWAIATVRAERAREDGTAPSVQLLAHCMGGLTAMMALAGGHAGHVRQMIVSQFSLHPVTGWFNQLKADLGLAHAIRQGLSPDQRALVEQLTGSADLAALLAGRAVFDLQTAPPPADGGGSAAQQEMLLDTLLWNVPFPDGEPCYSPTCHRVFGVFGPVYHHAQLNEATHDAIGAMAGAVATRPFEQLGEIMKLGRAVDARGRDVYLAHPERLDFPIHLISGALNQLVTPDTTLRTQHWLRTALPDSAEKFTRQVFPGFGHLDCFIGRDAAAVVFEPLIAELDRHAQP